MRVAFRTDGGGNGIGIGHLVRCIAIADALREKSVRCWFVCQDYPAGVQLIREHGYEVLTLSHQITQTVHDDLHYSLPLMHDADLVVVDSYKATTEYLLQLRSRGKKVVYLDDLLDRDLPVDVIIGNVYVSRESYGTKINANTLLLAGAAHLPLRQEFQCIPKRKIADQFNRVLLTFGGEDINNATEQVVKALFSYSRRLTLEILLGIAYPYQPQLEDLLASCPHDYNVQRDIRNMLSLYQQVDVAITASGSTVWELAAAGIPMVFIQTADNQKRIVQYMCDNQLGVSLGTSDDISSQNVCQALEELEDKKKRMAYSQRCQALVDGKGAVRIAEALHQLGESQIALRKAQPDPDSDDSRTLWLWRNDPVTRRMSRDSEFIPWETHHAWYVQMMQNPKTVLLMASEGPISIGMVRFDYRDSELGEININLNPTMRGRGLGKCLLTTACGYAFSQLGLLQLYAEIKPENIPSIKIFESAGFIFQGMREGLRTYLYHKTSF